MSEIIEKRISNYGIMVEAFRNQAQLIVMQARKERGSEYYCKYCGLSLDMTKDPFTQNHSPWCVVYVAITAMQGIDKYEQIIKDRGDV